MSSRNIRSILAVAALTAGVSWLATGPASADACGDKVSVLRAPTTVAAVCEELTGVRATGNYGEAMPAQYGGRAATVESLAKRLGLQGLSRASAVLSVADMGGVAAASGLPTLPAGVPGTAGLPNAASLAQLPDVPGLPALPGTPALTHPLALPALPGAEQLPGAARLPDVGAVRLPTRLPIDNLPDASGVTGVKSPITLPQPVSALQNEVTGALPKASQVLDGVQKSTPLPERKPAPGPLDGVLKILQVS